MDDSEMILTLTFEARENGLAVADVLEGSRTLLYWLAIAEEEPYAPAQGRTHWILRDWHHSLPTMVLAPISPDPIVLRAARRVYTTARRLSLSRCEGMHVDSAEERIFRRFARLSERVEIHLGINEEPFISMAATAKKILEQLPRDSIAEGILEGTLGSVTVYRKHEFVLWLSVSGKRVEVQFPKELQLTVIECLGKTARAKGRIVYRGLHPIRMTVDTLTLIPESTDVPLEEFFGIGRDWFGKQPSGELTYQLWKKNHE